ncbi:MAG: hypothetical protein IIY29_03385 [Firmicutes bacterium]|nr:hypothetical protein [Bacillota bacterium]
MKLIRVFILYYLVTAVTECALAYLLGLRSRRDQFLVLLVNLLTNPAVVYLSLLSAWFLAPDGRFAVLVLLEAAAIAVETFIYTKKLDWGELAHGTAAGALARGRPFAAALVLSLLLNAASYGMGELIEILIRQI